MKLNEKLKKVLLEKGLTQEQVQEIEETSIRKSNIANIDADISDELEKLKNLIRKINEKIINSNYVFGFYCKKKQ